MDYKDFFKEYGRTTIVSKRFGTSQTSSDGYGGTSHVWVEQLYQAFRSRLNEENNVAEVKSKK